MAVKSAGQLQPSRYSIHGQWSSRLHFILAATGAAVGLGNIWKFPYMAGSNGGGAFVIVYLICVALVGLPLLMAEMLIGRCGRCNSVESLRYLAEQSNGSTYWQYVGWWGAVTLLLVLSFYSVVAGWSIGYSWYAINGRFSGLSAVGVTHLWYAFQNNPWLLLLYHTVFMSMTLGVVARGLDSGLEWASKLMMPALFAILFLLLGCVSHLKGFEQGIYFLWAWNWSKITLPVIINAVGHAFFSLAIGAGCMLVYGSYLPDRTPIGSTALIIVFLNLTVALLAGVTIFSMVFNYGLTPAVGPSLMFQILPIAFAKMGGGRLFGVLFFLLLLFAAWTSSISLAEPLVVLLMERFGKTRVNASIVVGVSAWVLGIGCLLSFNQWHLYKFLGKWTIFEAITDLSTNIMLPIGGVLFALFTGYCLSKRSMQRELALPLMIFRVWLFLLRATVPAGLIVLLGFYFF